MPVARPVARRGAAHRELDALKRRDSAAWAALFEQEYPLIFRAVLAQVGDRDAAEDIAAQVFVEAIEGIGRYHDRGHPLSAWLLGIARHRCSDWFRRSARERGTPANLEPTVDGPEEHLNVALAALGELTPEQREVVHLRFVEGRPLEEVAQLTSRSVGAVKALQHRALARLRHIIGTDPEVWR